MSTGADRAEERRRHSRVGQVEVEYVAPGAAPARAKTQNISPGGAFILTEDPAEMGQVLQLKVLVGDRSVALKAEVRWTSRFRHAPGMGVQFLGDTTELEQLLLSLG